MYNVISRNLQIGINTPQALSNCNPARASAAVRQARSVLPNAILDVLTKRLCIHVYLTEY